MNKLLVVAFVMAASGLMAGCETMNATEHGSIVKVEKDGSRVENLSDYAAYAKTKKELADKPLFEMTCPANGCMVLSLKVNNPNAAADIAAPAPPPKIESASVGVARELKETIGLLVPLGMAGLVGNTVSKLFATFGGSVDNIAARIQAPAASVTTVNTASGGAAIGGSANTAPVTSTVAPVTSTQNTNSGNTNIACTSGTASGGNTTAQGAPSGGVTCR